jgi:uncharacterized protein (DUF983 family)
MQDSFMSSASADRHPENQGKAEINNCDLIPGSLCPKCGQDKLDYNGLLNLACPKCGFEQGGVYT